MTNNAINTASQVVQFLSTSSASVFTLNTAIPRDNTIPQNTEGVEILTLDIIPTKTDSTLLIEFSCAFTAGFTGGTSNDCCCALFQDSTAGALAAEDTRCRGGGTGPGGCEGVLVYAMAAGTTSSTTFKIRVGTNNANNAYLNADDGGTRLMGGVSQAILSITELY